MRDYHWQENFIAQTREFFPEECFGSQNTSEPFQVFVKANGRDDSKTGPKPYPTHYWAFRARSEAFCPRMERKAWAYCFQQGRWVLSTQVFHAYYQPVHTCNFPGLTRSYVDNQSILLPNVSSETIGKARERAISELRSENVNLGTSIGELPETIGFIVDTLARALRAILALLARDYGAAARLLGLTSVPGLAGNYLSYLFGFKPLANDIYNALSDMEDVMSRPGVLTPTGKARKTYTPSSLGFWYTGEITEGCEVGYVCKVTDHSLYSLSALGLLNPLAIAWEIVPLSFVIDWFFSVGSMIDALSAGIGLEVVSGYQTTYVKGSTSAHVYPPGGGWELKDDVAYKANVFAMKRDILPVIANPGLFMRTRPNLNLIWTLMALIAARR